MNSAPQRIFRIRRDYNSWVANETMEDYALRYTPHSARKWSEFRVANTAFGGISFLALEAIGGTIALNYGFTNALWAILVMGLITFLTGFPIAVYAARNGLDMDLLTRGAGFGYLGSTVTSLIYASFTFIFFAVEAAIMALALQLVFDWPLVWCYLMSALVALPLVLHGITLISRLQTWTQPLWAVLLLWPFLWFAVEQPGLYRELTGLSGLVSGSNDFDPLMFGSATAVAFSLVLQIGEQVDFLRFMPERTPANRGRWWGGVLVAGPGWVMLGMLKMLGGAFLAFVALQYGAAPSHAVEPTQMYLAGFRLSLGNPELALWLTVLFVVVSQIKINVTNAYAGSLAWSNFFARLTRSHPGRVVWLVFNVIIGMLLMTLGVFGALEKVLGLYSNVAIAWVGALVADLVINKPLGLSPKRIEFRRAYLYDLNPVGLGAMGLAVLLAGLAYAGVLGATAAAFSPFIALFTALLAAPLLAWATGGHYYLARHDASPWQPGEVVRCTVCENQFESADMATCPAYGAPICSLCCSLESRCHDRCKHHARATDQLRQVLAVVLPAGLHRRFNFRVAQYFTVFFSLTAVMAFLLAVVYMQESLQMPADALRVPFIKAFSLLAVLAAVCAWWVVLTNESRRMAQDESERQTQLLQKEIDAHQRTDEALQSAKDAAENASNAKTRYVAGMTHELRTPLNSILGYAQILLRKPELRSDVREAVITIQQSGQHMHALIDGLLDLARIEAGRLRLDMAPLPFPEFLSELVRMVRPQAEGKGLAFRLETCGRVPSWVQADAKRLRQILINLLGNAVRFTHTGAIVFRVDCRHDVVRFEVEDTGIGIAPQDQERIFMPFERGSAGRRASEVGTGLGLTITHLLTELMGGELTLRSEVGQGSTFSVRLYLREIIAPAQKTVRDLRPIVGYLAPRRTLLVVDDQPIQRQLLASLLLPLGFAMREAASGREALEILQSEWPDAVLLDINMDDLNGWQTAQLIRRQVGITLPIVFVSADPFENRPELLAAAGCQGFVSKPVIESELLDLLARVLQLEWVHESNLLPPLSDTPAVALATGPLPLPEDLRMNLVRLARLGNASGLRQLLRSTAEEEPAMADLLQGLVADVDRFDFHALIDRLKATDDEC
ncbi:hybrid sensor histidine kinase/response regulator [Extensimonas vulgaris]|jgi:signal transduction histidine kinase/purine-cytosine permease-like protein/DNA-binding NarL/FixJ family response regulator|uniref:Virulence sensor protein BvgS n=1 Tax=Extensimonas vulgaris TaxID=1031594 RepID=A0A369AS20_9BURK|nr:ATP-binding protein [Extensimonas vulgaris]RCX11017.1 signal transduction histidine kinase [Extensimonas vulgaris]TWI41691.1 signal transduction histidine kinase [Extensimonas vulgaris]TXD16156.1 response regulator [Extensimonas vulgaris]